MPDFPSVTAAEIAEALPGFGRTLILTHVNPDADCIGSALGLRELIRAAGGDAKIACPSPLPHYVAFMPESGGIAPEDLLLSEGEECSFDTVLSVDVASPMQLGALSVCIPRVRYMIDHHAQGTPFAPALIDPEAAAAGEIVLRLYDILRERGTVGTLPDAARFLYCAIVGDTGGFQFSNTSPSTHLAAAALLGEINRDAALSGKPDAALLCRRLLAERSLTELRCDALTVRNMRLYENGRIAAALFTTDMLRAEGLTETDLGGAIDVPRSVEGVDIALTVRQTAADPAKFKVSSRANGDFDCASVCAAFGGGGHTRAAGCTLEAASPEEAFETAVAAFSALVRPRP